MNNEFITVNNMFEKLQLMIKNGYGDVPITINGEKISCKDGYYNCSSKSSARINLTYNKK